MVRSSNRALGPEDFDTPGFDACKSLRACNFVYEVLVNKQHGGTAFDFFNHVAVPDLIKKCFSCQNVLIYKIRAKFKNSPQQFV